MLVLGLGSGNLVLALMMVGLGLVWLFAPGFVQAAGLAQETGGDPYASIAAAAAVGIGSIGAAYAVSTTGSAAVGAIAEKPEVFGRALIFVGLAEGVAIYGLIIAFIILNR
jgi:V/A-type H+-transporting ATPase subunit K